MESNNFSQNSEVMSFGQWLLTLFLTSIPFVNIILLLIWAFGSNVNPNKKNFSKAALVLMIIGFVLSLIFSATLIGLLASLGGMNGMSY